MTPPTEPTEGAPRPVVDTARAADALDITPAQLENWAQAGIVTPRHIDPDGESWWEIDDLRRQIAAYLHGRDEDE